MKTVKARHNRTGKVVTIEIYAIFIYVREYCQQYSIETLDHFAIMEKK